MEQSKTYFNWKLLPNMDDKNIVDYPYLLRKMEKQWDLLRIGLSGIRITRHCVLGIAIPLEYF